MKTFQNIIKILFVAILFSISSWGQQASKDTILRTAKIQTFLSANKVTFTANAPQLRQIAGAPKAYYSNYWEFGDGHYSKENAPTHTYKNKGEYTVRLAATNNYDDGLPPTSRPQKIIINEVGAVDFDDENNYLLAKHHGFRLVNDREPSPGQEMQFVVSYANKNSYTTQGKLYVFFNEKKYKNKNFNLIDTRAYYGEKEIIEEEIIATKQSISLNKLTLTSGIETISDRFLPKNDSIEKSNLPATLQKAKDVYQDYKIWEFDNLHPQEKRNIFMTFKTTPDMLKDTTAIISIRSVFLPDKGGDKHQVRTKEMEIVTSHDPNKMAVYNTRINYRLMRYKRLKYKVRFQNNGEGPAKLIKLNVAIPEMLDKTTLKVIDMYPKVPICPDGEDVQFSCLDTVRIKDKISFQFKNIYLPGSNQKGVHEKDSTKGFVKYSMKFGKKVRKIRSRSKTAIIFDKNEPILTNTATSRFSTGLSIGAITGYNLFLSNKDLNNIDPASLVSSVNTIKLNEYSEDAYGCYVGASISPYKSYRWYLQSEISIDRQKNSKNYNLNYVDEALFEIENAEGVVYEEILPVHVNEKYKSHTMQTNILLVPASLRVNVNSIISLGAGVQLNLRTTSYTTENTEKRYFQYNPRRPEVLGEIIESLYSNESKNTELGFKLYDYMPFIDVTIGASRIGPSIGARYLYPIKQTQGVIQLYAIWKF